MRITGNIPNRAACTKLGIPRPEDDAADMRLQAGACAHRARFERDDKRAIGKVPSTECMRGLSHGLDLGMGQRIAVGLPQVATPADHLSGGIQYHGPDGYLPFGSRLTRQPKRDFHTCIPCHASSVRNTHINTPW